MSEKRSHIKMVNLTFTSTGNIAECRLSDYNFFQDQPKHKWASIITLLQASRNQADKYICILEKFWRLRK